MWWIVLTFTAILPFTAGDLINKFIVREEVMDPHLAAAIFGFVTFIVFTVVSLALSGVLTQVNVVLPGLAIGILSTVGLWFYFSAISKEEISRAMPILATAPLFVLPMAFFLFEESFTSLKYLGIGLVVTGSISLSFKKTGGVFKFDKAAALMFVTALLFAIRNILIKIPTQSLGVWPLLFWMGVGHGVLSLGILLVHHPHLKRKAQRGAEHLFLTGSLSALGMVSLLTAISLGPVSLISALEGVKPLLVLVFATLITILHPSFIHETVTKTVVAHKTISTLMIVLGAALIVL